MTKRKLTLNRLIEFFLANKALCILVVLMLIAQPLTNGLFFRFNNLMSVARQISVSLIVSVGYTVLLASGSMDLSAGEQISLMGIVFAMCSRQMAFGYAILITCALGIVCGFLNGFIAIKFKLTPFIVTLAMAQVFRGITYVICNAQSISDMNSSVKFIGQGILFGFLPFSLAIALVVTIIAAIFIHKTKTGRHVLAVGGNLEASRVSGINVFKIKVLGFAVLGLCCAIASVVLTGRVAMAMPAAGDGYTLDCIAAVSIGGTPMHGGRAKPGGTIVGSLTIGLISNVLNLSGVDSFWQYVAKGLVILLAVFLDSVSDTFFKEQQRKSAAAA